MWSIYLCENLGEVASQKVTQGIFLGLGTVDKNATLGFRVAQARASALAFVLKLRERMGSVLICVQKRLQ
ncbi:hypothetical protein B9N43_00630 [Denitratisoma sp. DHT3]|nr:hypothetical protein B9N43_00630 [Denitratisoma sp. DHT3]